MNHPYLIDVRRSDATGRQITAQRILVCDGRQLDGELKIIAAILEQSVIEKFLAQLGLQARAPPRTPARGSQMQAA